MGIYKPINCMQSMDPVKVQDDKGPPVIRFESPNNKTLELIVIMTAIVLVMIVLSLAAQLYILFANWGLQ